MMRPSWSLEYSGGATTAMSFLWPRCGRRAPPVVPSEVGPTARLRPASRAPGGNASAAAKEAPGSFSLLYSCIVSGQRTTPSCHGEGSCPRMGWPQSLVIGPGLLGAELVQLHDASVRAHHSRHHGVHGELVL